MAKLKFNVKGMHCKSCSMLVNDSLTRLGAESVKIILDEKSKKAVVSCDYNGKEADIVTAIKKEGYGVEK
jgi:copper chaperone CopZ